MTAEHSTALRTTERAVRCGRRQLLAVLLLAAILVFAGASVAKADEPVFLRDPSLRAAVVGQLVSQGRIPAGSDGTTITPSDMDALTTLSAPNRGIERLDGLQDAADLTFLDLSGNSIVSIARLSGLTRLSTLDVRDNRLDVTPGSPAASVIAILEGSGTAVTYAPQRSCLTQPTVSSSASVYGKWVTFSASVGPRGAASSCAPVVRLCHLETKTVTEVIKGTQKKVAVNYWRLLVTLTMKASAPGGRRAAIDRQRPGTGLTFQSGSTGDLSVAGKLPSPGRWQAQVAYAGSACYEPCTSTARAFVVQDPRIEPAISWAMRQLGSHGWDHYCLRFVCDAYTSGARASVHRYETAKQAADALHAAAHPGTDAPRGAWVFYHSMHGSTDLGHVGISLGDGTMINDNGGEGVKIMSIARTAHYIGWAAPPLSPPITDWLEPTKD